MSVVYAIRCGATILMNSRDVITIGTAQLIFTANYGYSYIPSRQPQQIQLQPVEP